MKKLFDEPEIEVISLEIQEIMATDLKDSGTFWDDEYEGEIE